MALEVDEGRSACRRSHPSNVASTADTQCIARPLAPANGPVWVYDNTGVVLGVVASRTAARAFLREGAR